MEDLPVSATLDSPNSLVFQRIRAVARLLGLAVSVDASWLRLALDTSAASRTPSWSSGEIARAEHVSRSGPVPGGLACPSIFGDLHEPNLSRFGHIALPCFVVPWPARQVLAPLFAETADDLLTRNVVDPESLLARIQAAHDVGQTVLGHSPLEFVWWSLPVMAPILRAEEPGVALVMNGETCFTHALHDAYRRVTNRALRVRRLMELDAPAVILENERRMLVCGVDELLANVDLEQPRMSSDEETSVPAFDAIRLFFAALGTRLVENSERHDGTIADATSWIATAAQVGRGHDGSTSRLVALWHLAAEQPAEPMNAAMREKLGLSELRS